MTTILIELCIGAFVGLSLGLLGGGGAVLIVPSMVYLLNVDEHIALATALIIVGINALVGGVIAWRDGRTQIRTALIFGASGMVTAYIGALISRTIDGRILLTVFSILLLIIAVLMYRGNAHLKQRDTPHSLWVIVAVGAGVGLITGTLGVGGGFVIVPSMVLLVGLPMRNAVGTSLLVIAMNSSASLIGHLDTPFDWTLIGVLLAGALPAMAISGRISASINQDKLRKAFALFITVVALFMLGENVVHFSQ
ncbi:MAG: sulfite exporter TauE/SafE family protein [Chloroflexi bacterium]|nr:sulfite exporter TauE/SafE family protein [Chloroflexota bacterium]